MKRRWRQRRRQHSGTNTPGIIKALHLSEYLSKPKSNKPFPQLALSFISSGVPLSVTLSFWHRWHPFTRRLCSTSALNLLAWWSNGIGALLFCFQSHSHVCRHHDRGCQPSCDSRNWHRSHTFLVPRTPLLHANFFSPTHSIWLFSTIVFWMGCGTKVIKGTLLPIAGEHTVDPKKAWSNECAVPRMSQPSNGAGC